MNNWSNISKSCYENASWKLRGFVRQLHLRETVGLKNVNVQLSSHTARLMEFLRGRLGNSRGSCNFRMLRAVR